MTALDEEILSLLRFAAENSVMPRWQNLAESEIEEKAKGDLVTVVDREVEEFLTEALTKLAPGVAVVGEEAAAANPAVLERLSDACWIIDPVDGTHNYAHGRTPFGIIVALADGGETIGGWIYDPVNQRFCHARRNEGAFVNGERIASTATGENMPIAAISKLFITPDQVKWVEEHIEPHFRLVEIPRCAAEQYPRLALGENDISSFNRTLPWDHAAGVLWLNEAGGKATRYDGGSYRVDEHARPGLLAASSPALWDDYRKLIEPLVGKAP
ncbi:inositol monophosphatase family protein [Tsuneonella mangrovi]|uniref:inositol monophosphatase family protein n=1 Tax=Tsuneonella mangrovi TaxID=1982042 RepID=UPI000BA2746C|nr:inositol monophosphatase [Tsuneonella mangrovi]